MEGESRLSDRCEQEAQDANRSLHAVVPRPSRVRVAGGEQHRKLHHDAPRAQGVHRPEELRPDECVGGLFSECSFGLSRWAPAVSTPFAYSCKKTPKDAEDQIEAAHGAARAIRLEHGTSFTVSATPQYNMMRVS